MKLSKNGADAFNRHFDALYQDRWPSLLESLKAESPKTAFMNYFMDRASIIAANALPFKDGDRVLDMCSAPGGKALAMLSRANPTNSFVLNERSATRRARLQKVITEHLGEPPCDIRFTSHDATKWGLYEKNAYEAILLDAPCSSERHLLEKPSLLAEWSPNRTKTLAIQQFAMLAAALDAVKAGGNILYATCSISPAENDDVIAKLLKKRNGFEVSKLHFDEGEPTQHGWIFLPDRCRMGPLFVALVKRR
jgi:16S rRNA C967 or C1407 C5-methylase (RsmB/RsmF family)